MEQDLLARILTGEATLEEKERFYKALKSNGEEEKLFYEVKGLWVRASMGNTRIDQDAEFENLWKRIAAPSKRFALLPGRKVLQYAAIILIVLGIGGAAGYFLSKNRYLHSGSGIQCYSSMKGSVSKIEFPDGTKVWLNSDSRLTYQEDYKTRQRIAELSGEAYFEIKHRDNFPFRVKAGQIEVRDLGTTFNVKAYPEDHYIETALVEGKADILTNKGDPLVSLNPGESAMYYPERKKIELRSISSNVLSDWRNGRFVIRDERLEDIFKELGRWYDVKFRFEDQKLKDYRFTGNLKKSTTVLHVLEMLKLTTDFNYRVVEKDNGPDLIIIY